MTIQEHGITGQAPENQPPRYRGLSGAVLYGAFLAGVFVVLGIVLGSLVAVLTGNGPAASLIMRRLVLLGLAVGLSAAACMMIGRSGRDRLRSLSVRRGDLGGRLGFLAAALLLGSLAELGLLRGDEGPTLMDGQPLQIAGPTLDGKRFDLAEHRGKVVLVDFWATWCGPCLAEMPHLRQAYEKFHSDGLEIVGVSLDFDRAQLQQFIEQQRIPWPQIFFDTPRSQGWNNPVGRQFGINAIPRMLVIDAEGRLVRPDVRGAEIDAAVASLLGRPANSGTNVISWLSRAFGWLSYGLFRARPWQMLLLVVGASLGAGTEELWRRRTDRPTAS